MRTGSSLLSSFLVVAGALVAVAAPSTARAFTADAKQPTEFGRLDRARVVDPVRQRALNASPNWQAFQALHGEAWRATWDDRAGTPRSIIGGTIPLVPMNASAAQVETASRAFLDSLQSLSGVDSGLLRTAVLTKVRDTWFVRFDRVTASGGAILGAYAELRIVRGNVVLIRLETHPAADVGLDAPKLSAAGAARKAEAAIGAFRPIAGLAPSQARRVIVPVAVRGGWAYRHGYEIETSSLETANPGRWRSVVDAVHGEVLSRESLIRFAVSGTLRGNVEARTVTDAPAPQTMPFIRVTVGATPVTADANGLFVSGAADGSNVTATLAGPFVNVNNEAGADLSVTYAAAGANGDYLWSDASNQALAQLDSYRSASRAREWALGVTPGLAWLQETLPVNVNIADQCNAYWDGTSINFFDEGNFCNNTARVADVVYHEFGHGFHQNNLVSGVVDGAIGEGSGDYISATITSSSDLGPYFQKDGSPVRELEANQVYPDDVVGQVHQDGLIWGGAMWDLRKALIATHGDALGRATADGIFARALSAGPTLDQVYEEVLLADDDNGDLADGTPNQCDIDAAFGLHGLNSAGGAFLLAHTEITRDEVQAGQAIAVSATLPESTSLCPGGGISAATLRYKIADGATQSAPLTLSANVFSGELPAIEAGNTVRYWFEASTDGGNVITTPPSAPDNVYAFYVGPLFTIFEAGFESGSTEWEHGGIGDDWEIGTPAGNADPIGAYEGTKAFGNSIGGNGEYRPEANNWTESPVIDCGGCSGTRLQYRRWLSVEDAVYDRARILVVVGDTEHRVFENPQGNGGNAVRDRIWGFQDIDISEFADGRNFKVRFELDSDQGLEFGGWTIDALSIVTPGEPTSGGGGGHGLFGCSVTTTRAPALPLSALVLSLGALGAMLRRRRT